jgi:hypothetical protein
MIGASARGEDLNEAAPTSTGVVAAEPAAGTDHPDGDPRDSDENDRTGTYHSKV